MARTPDRHRTGQRQRLGERIVSASGTTGPELLATIAITVMVLSLGIFGLKSTFVNTSMMAQAVANDVRLARVYAVTRGAHYRVTLGSNWYKTERLQDNDNDKVWDPDTTVAALQRNLKGGATIVASTGRTSSGSALVEFDTRGMVVPDTGSTVPNIMTVTVTGSTAAGAERGTSTVYIWPSGQVELLHAGEIHS